MDKQAETGSDLKEEEGTITERTLRLLDSEIDHIRHTQSQQGWTSWGLVGAVVGSFWLLSDELEPGNIRVEIVALAVLLFSTLIDALRYLFSQLWVWKNPANETSRIRWSNELFSGNELFFVLEILRSIGLLVVAFFFAPMWWLAFSFLSIAYAWFLLMAIAWVALTQAEYPIRQGFTTKGFAFILAFIVPCVASFFLYLTLAPVPVGDVVSSYRVGGLLVAVSYLVILLHSLIRIRRDIAFNRVDINSAASQAEIALKGMEVSDAIQKDVSPICLSRENPTSNPCDRLPRAHRACVAFDRV
jgi:hypothetical protein